MALLARLRRVIMQGVAASNIMPRHRHLGPMDFNAARDMILRLEKENGLPHFEMDVIPQELPDWVKRIQGPIPGDEEDKEEDKDKDEDEDEEGYDPESSTARKSTAKTVKISLTTTPEVNSHTLILLSPAEN
jgi:hypothetical protein